MQQLGQRVASIIEPPGTLPGRSEYPFSVVNGSELDVAVERACQNLLAQQRPDGHWCGELEGDTILESEYLLLLHFLDRTHEARAAKAAEYLRRKQLAEGGWALYPGGPPEVSASVKAYFALKLQGDSPDAPHMLRARRSILELGGLEATNTYTKTYLAIFGQYPWKRCPAIPPELMLLPRWFYFNVYEMSSWSRAIFVPLSIIWAHKPYCPVPADGGIQELFIAPVQTDSEASFPPRERRWRAFFFAIDRLQKHLERNNLTPLRGIALKAAEQWVRRRLEKSDGLGAIFPSIVNTIIAFRCIGYEASNPLVASQIAELEKLEIEDAETLRLQPCLSPVWDTAQAACSLVSAGLRPDDPALRAATRWLLDREVRLAGDWRMRNPRTSVGGWYFEYANEFYPDCDDTAEVLTALAHVCPEDPALRKQVAAARRRGLAWLLSMQNRDGGWAAFDKECTKEVLTLVPFADHNAMIDPSCEDITGRVLETLAVEGLDRSHPAVARGIQFLRDKQLPDGTWYGRWGANYIYGTWLALVGLARVGEDLSEERYHRAALWLRQQQNEDGGWGESLASYDDPTLKGVGPSTASQTAWALLALFAAGESDSESVHRGIDFLLARQSPDGTWDDHYWTGTGFPKVFYLRYHLYDDYFPLLALATYRGLRGKN